jgi:hypothetical protein
MNLTIEASRLFLSIRLGRWEFFAQPKSAPGYDTDHVRGPLALVRTGGAAQGWAETTVEIPFFALSLVNHHL